MSNLLRVANPSSACRTTAQVDFTPLAWGQLGSPTYTLSTVGRDFAADYPLAVALWRPGRRNGSVRRHWTRAAVVLAMAVSSGCTGQQSTGASTVVVDSAGIRIVTNPPGSIEAAPAWSLSPEPSVDIGSEATPDVAFHQVTAVVPLGDGRVAVGTNSPPRAQLFESDGSVVATLGGEGQGPGEFSTVTSIVPLGADSLAVWDQNRRRISVFSLDGTLLREADLSDLALPSPMAAGSTNVLAAFSYLLSPTPGSFVLFGVGGFGPGSVLGRRRVAVPSYRISANGEKLATYGPFPGTEIFELGDQGGTAMFPFGADTYGVAAADFLVVGTAEAPELRFYGPTGSLEQVARWPDRDRSVVGPFLSDWTDFVESWLAPMSPDERDLMRTIMERIPHPETFPAYDGVIGTDTGLIWVGAYAGEFSSLYPPRAARVPARRWLIFGTDGLLTAIVHTPEGFQPHAVRERLVWGVFTDELGVESVQAYEIVT